jgi:hypothetical protein
MLGFNFIKVDPSTYLMKYSNGRIAKEGAGLSLFYYAPTTSLVSVPIGSEDAYFMFSELTHDFQEVTIQGQVTYKVTDVHALAKMLNYSLNVRGEYISDDPKKLPKRIISLVQMAVRKELSELSLKEAMSSAETIDRKLKDELKVSSVLKSLGVEIIELSIVAVKPNQETARALEAETREVLLRQADEAVYIRRNAAIEQERIIKENELQTEVTVEEKKREIMERKLEAEKIVQEKRQQISEAEMSGKIILQKQNEELVQITAENSKKEADAKAYAMDIYLDAIRRTDPKTIQVLAMNGMNPSQLIAASFQQLAENADKIGQLNISPDLLGQLMQDSYVTDHRK